MGGGLWFEDTGADSVVKLFQIIMRLISIGHQNIFRTSFFWNYFQGLLFHNSLNFHFVSFIIFPCCLLLLSKSIHIFPQKLYSLFLSYYAIYVSSTHFYFLQNQFFVFFLISYFPLDFLSIFLSMKGRKHIKKKIYFEEWKVANICISNLII